jgi:PAS domain S-box-containing protein
VGKDGRTRWVRFHYVIERGPDRDGALQLFGVAQNVTDESEAKAASLRDRDRLHAAFDHSPIGQVIVSRDQILLAVNPAFCQLTGYTAEELVGGSPSQVVHPEFVPVAQHRFEQLRHVRADRIDQESIWRTKDGRTIEVELTVVPERDADGKALQFFTSVQDVTERNRANEELNRLAAIVRSSDDAIEGLTLDGIITSWSPGAERVYGYTKEEMVGAVIDKIIPPERTGELLPVLADVARVGGVQRLETNRVRKDGTLIDVWLSVSPIRDAADAVAGASVIARDITDVKRSQRERQSLMERLVDAHAEERVRLARELHDGLGQMLTSAALYARSIEDKAPASLVDDLSVLRSQLEEALAATRTLMWRLRPVEIETLGLVSAVRSLAEKIRRRHDLEVDVHISPVDGLSSTAETALYRVVQEAVTNAVRHADPHAISIVIAQRGDLVTAVVEDDGCGFTIVEPGGVPSRRAGLGLVGMQERAAALAGRLAVDSHPGRGTMVRLELPVAAQQP